MMAQGDLVAAQLLGIGIEVASSHSGAEVAGRFVHIHHHIKDIGFKDPDGNPHQLCVGFDQSPVVRMITRVHHNELQTEIHLSMAAYLLHAFSQQHGVLTTGNADGDVVSLFYHLIFIQCLNKRPPDIFAILLDDAPFDIAATVFHSIRFLSLIVLSSWLPTVPIPVPAAPPGPPSCSNAPWKPSFLHFS